jgi:hypothetical protein
MSDETKDVMPGDNGADSQAKLENTDADLEGEAPVEEVKRKEKTLPARPSLKDALERIESIGKEMSVALRDRFNVVQVRVNDDSLRYLDMLVEADITKSRSESAAFLITEGIRANATLFERIGEITDQIAELRSQLKVIVRTDVE